LGFGLLAAALALAPLPALAQDSGDATTNTPATDAIGPRELQNFSIQGTVTRPAEPQPAARAPAKPTVTAAPRESSRPAAPTPDRQVAQTTPETTSVAQPKPREVASTPRTLGSAVPSSTVTVALPRLQDDSPRGGTTTVAPAAAPGFAADPETVAPERKVALLPWLLAAIALGAGGAYLFYRRRHEREAFAGGPQIDAFSAPEPAIPVPPAPKPAVSPPEHPPSSIPGLVSTRLRPWIDMRFEPLRCVVEDNQVTVEFELELLNSGSAPARAVLVEATLFNAGPNQDSEIGAFFTNPVGAGDRIASIAPLQRMVLRPKVTIAREQVQIFEAGGRKVFVPLIAFNALYRWSGGDGQSSVSYLVGRDTKGEKLAPFRMDLGARVFRGLGSRPLPLGVRQ